jgi:hypothetical protein
MLHRESGEGQGEEEIEGANYLKPDLAAHALKGAKKSAQAAGYSAGRVAGCTAGGVRLLGNHWTWGGLCARLPGTRHVLTGDAACHANSSAEYATDGVRFHLPN